MIKYVNGNIEIKEGSHRHVLEPAKTVGEETQKEAFYGNESALIQSICAAVWPAHYANKTEVKMLFNPATCIITAGNDKITPDTDLSAYPEEVRVFAETVYQFNNAAATRLYRAKHEMIEITAQEATEDVPETREVKTPVTKYKFNPNSGRSQAYQDIQITHEPTGGTIKALKQGCTMCDSEGKFWRKATDSEIEDILADLLA